MSSTCTPHQITSHDASIGNGAIIKNCCAMSSCYMICRLSKFYRAAAAHGGTCVAEPGHRGPPGSISPDRSPPPRSHFRPARQVPRPRDWSPERRHFLRTRLLVERLPRPPQPRRLPRRLPPRDLNRCLRSASRGMLSNGLTQKAHLLASLLPAQRPRKRLCSALHGLRLPTRYNTFRRDAS